MNGVIGVFPAAFVRELEEGEDKELLEKWKRERERKEREKERELDREREREEEKGLRSPEKKKKRSLLQRLTKSKSKRSSLPYSMTHFRDSGPASAPTTSNANFEPPPSSSQPSPLSQRAVTRKPSPPIQGARRASGASVSRSSSHSHLTLSSASACSTSSSSAKETIILPSSILIKEREQRFQRAQSQTISDSTHNFKGSPVVLRSTSTFHLTDIDEEERKREGRRYLRTKMDTYRWRFSESQEEILVRHFILFSVSPPPNEISKLYEVVGAVGADGATVSRNMIVLWFKSNRARFALQGSDSSSGPSVGDSGSFFALLVRRGMEKNWRFSPTQVRILVKYFLIHSMSPATSQISELYLEIGEEGQGSATVSKNMISMWFKKTREDLVEMGLDMGEWSWDFGLYWLALGFESQWLSTLLESDLAESNFGHDEAQDI